MVATAFPTNGEALVSSLLRRQVMVNDKQGDGYVGLLVSIDDKMLRLEGVGASSVKFIDGASKATVDLPWVNLFVCDVKFFTEVT